MSFDHMRIVKAESASPIDLGRWDEKNVTCVTFDLAPYIKTYGEGVPQLTVKKPGDTNEYAAAVEREGNTAFWIVGREWLTKDGQGWCQLSWHVTDGVKKSQTYKTRVSEAMGMSNEAAKEPQVGYLAQVQAAGVEATRSAAEARKYAAETAATAERIEAVAEDTLDAVGKERQAAENAATYTGRIAASVGEKAVEVERAKTDAQTAASAAALSEKNTEEHRTAAESAEKEAKNAAAAAKESATTAAASEQAAQAHKAEAQTAAAQITGAMETIGRAKEEAEQSAVAAGERAVGAAASEQAAQAAAALAEGYSSHPPVIDENGNWWVWDGEKYADSGETCTGNELYANALKGTASGEDLHLTDVSPLEHTMSVQMKSKNLLQLEDEWYRAQAVTIVTSAVDGTITVESNLLYDEYGFGWDVTPAGSLPAGDYVFSCGGKAENVAFEIRCSPHAITFPGGDPPFTEDGVVRVGVGGSRWFRLLNDESNISFTLTNSDPALTYKPASGTVNPMLEVGAVATEFSPYISDVSGVDLMVDGGRATCQDGVYEFGEISPIRYPATADGHHSVTSLSDFDLMKLYMDAEPDKRRGIILECQYNRDTTGAIQELSGRTEQIEANMEQTETRIQQVQSVANSAADASVGTYELVETITTTEELTSIVRTAWPDGTAYNFKAMLVKFEIPLSYAASRGLVVVNYGRGTTSDYFISITARQYCWSRIFKDFDRWQTEFAKAVSKYAAQVYRFAGVNEKFDSTPVQRLGIGANTSGVPFPIGTTIKIYGVRA